VWFIFLTLSQGLQEYFSSTFQTGLVSPVMYVAAPLIHESIQMDRDCTFSMCRSTGRLCADLVPSNVTLAGLTSSERPTLDRLFSLNIPHMEAMVIDSLTLQQFHAICCWNGSHWGVSMNERTVHLGAILVNSGSYRDYLDEVLSSSNMRIDSHRWEAIQGWQDMSTRGEVTEDGWTRYPYFVWPAWRSAHSY
jgi:hypothetical protein